MAHRASSLDHPFQSPLPDKKRTNSQQHLLHMEKQLETCSSPRLRQPPSLPYPSLSLHNLQSVSCVFQMPLHYPRYALSDYERMPESTLDRLLEEYGLHIPSSLSEKRELAIGSFLWKK